MTENNVMTCFVSPRPLLQFFWHGGDIVAAPAQPPSFTGGLHAVCKELKLVIVMVIGMQEALGILLLQASC